MAEKLDCAMLIAELSFPPWSSHMHDVIPSLTGADNFQLHQAGSHEKAFLEKDKLYT
jgi:hypothetical protein